MKNIPHLAEDVTHIPTANNDSDAAFVESAPDKSILNNGGEVKGQRHSFSRKLAKEIHAKKRKFNSKAKHAAHECTVLKYLAHKVRRSKHNIGNKNWFYSTIEELAKVFPYLGETTIYETVLRLRDLGYLEIGNFNHWRQDKTFWYHVPPAVCHATEEDLVYFDALVATDVGVVAAVLQSNFEHWIKELGQKGLPLQVEMSPVVLAKLLPFSLSAIKKGLGDLEGKYVQRLSKTMPLFGMPQIGSYPNRTGSNPNSIGSYPNTISSNPNDVTHCKPITNPLETCSKGEPAALPLSQTSLQDEQMNDVGDASAQSIATHAAEQNGKKMTTDKTISPFINLFGFRKDDVHPASSDLSTPPFISISNDGQQGHLNEDKGIFSDAVFSSADAFCPSTPTAADEDAAAGWPNASSLAELHTLTGSYAQFAEFNPKQQEEKDLFLSTISEICLKAMARIDPALADQWFEHPDGDTILRGLLPGFHEVMAQTAIDPLNGLFEPFYCGALECLVGSFLWRQDGWGNYSHPMSALLPVTHDLYLELWDRAQKKREAEVHTYFEELKAEHRSVDESKEDDTDLAPAEKTRVFRNGLNARNKVGWLFYDQTRRVDQIKHIGPKALNLVERLFTLNSEAAPADLLIVMDECMKEYSQAPSPQRKENFKNGKPPFGVKWHAHMGHDLIFFVTNLHWVVEQLKVTSSCGVTTFLRDAKQAETRESDELALAA